MNSKRIRTDNLSLKWSNSTPLNPSNSMGLESRWAFGHSVMCPRANVLQNQPTAPSERSNGFGFANFKASEILIGFLLIRSEASEGATSFLQGLPTARDWQMDFCKPFRRLGIGKWIFARHSDASEIMIRFFFFNSDTSGRANGFLYGIPTPRERRMDFCKAFRRIGKGK